MEKKVLKCATPLIEEYYASLTPEERVEADRRFFEALRKIKENRKLKNSSNNDDLKGQMYTENLKQKMQFCLNAQLIGRPTCTDYNDEFDFFYYSKKIDVTYNENIK